MTFSDSCGRWSAAKKAKEGSEQRVSLLIRSVLFTFWYLIFCFQIILGIKYLTFYDFKVLVSCGEYRVYWYPTTPHWPDLKG